MKLSFKPFPGLTAVTVIALAILIALGSWQYQRLQWKTALLTEIDIAADAPPFTSIRDVQKALDANEPIDFRRFGAEGLTPEMSPVFLVFTPRNRDVSWRIFTPLSGGGDFVFGALGVVSDRDRDEIFGSEVSRKDGEQAATATIGYVRLARPKLRGQTESTPEKNRWFGFNPMPETHSWAEDLGSKADMRFYIDTVPEAGNAQALPIRRPDIRNNHFDYMLTWYGLALVLFVIYLLLHSRAGRLTLE